MRTAMWGNQGGFVVILLALCLLVVIFGFAGLAIDVGRAYVVRGQLHDAADAVALAAAAVFYPSSAIDPTTTRPIPNWDEARDDAKELIKRQRADGEFLSSCEVAVGWWNVMTSSWEAGSPVEAGLPPTTAQGICSNNGVSCTTDANCTPPGFCSIVVAPAVMTRIEKSAGLNGGGVRAFFAAAVGWKEFEPAAVAVAVADTPKMMPPGSVFPFALREQVRDEFMLGNGPSGVITFTSIYGGGPEGGQWSGLSPGNTSGADTLKSYLLYLMDPSSAGGQASPAVNVAGFDPPTIWSSHDTVHIETGAAASVFTDVKAMITARKGRVYMPVVGNNLAANTDMDVRCFISVQLTDAEAPTKKLKGYLVMPSRLVR